MLVHAQRNFYYGKSVGPSHSGIVSKPMHLNPNVKLFAPSDRNTTLVFLSTNGV